MGQRIFKRLRDLLDVDFSTFADGDRVVYHAATDEFVGMAAAGGAADAADVTVTPAGGIAATDVQAALEELDSEKAATSHVHSGADITSGTVADARIASTIARDSEVTAAVAAEATARDAAIATSEAGQVRDGDAAGGVLAGTYPSPSFAADMATQAELDAAVAAAVPATRTITAGSGLTGGGTLAADRTLDVQVDASTIEIASDTLRVKDGGITSAKIADGTIVAGDLAFDPATQAELDAAVATLQPLDSDLTAIAALSTTTYGRALLALADAAALRTAAGLVIGTDVQAFDSDLAAFAGLAIAADKLPYGNGSHTLALADFTPAARALLDDADAAAMRTTLGVIASLFQSGGAQAIKLDDLATPDDNTDLDASTSRHGLLQKLPGGTSTFLRADGSFATPAAGGVTQSYVGYNTIGGTVETMTNRRVYAKKITLAAGGFLTSIDAHIRTNNADHAAGVSVGVFSDSSGTPDLLMAYVQQTTVAMYLSKAGATNGSFRWVSFPIGIYLPAGDYWIYVQHTTASTNSIDIHKDGSGSDRYQTPSFDGNADWGGLYSPTTTTDRYSIRGNILQ